MSGPGARVGCFENKKDKKVLILLSEIVPGYVQKEDEYLKKLLKAYKSFGYSTMVMVESELEDESVFIDKIHEFMGEVVN